MTFGLWLFLAMWALVTVSLAIDGLRWLAGMPTISSYARAHLWARILVIAPVVLSLVGLILHLRR